MLERVFMSGFDLQKLNSQQTSKVADITTSFNPTKQSADVGEIRLDQSDKFKALKAKYGIKEEQLAELLRLCQQKGIDALDISAKDEVDKLVNAIKTKTPETFEVQAHKAEITPEPQKKTTTGISHKEFVELSKEQKVEVLVQELAKNKFLYGDKNNKKTENEWNALSAEDRNKFIEEYRPQLKEKITQIYNSKSDNKTENFEEIKSAILGLANDKDLNRAHTTILAIDFQTESIENLIIYNNNLTEEKEKEVKQKIEEYYHDYLAAQDNKDLTDDQIRYLDESSKLSQAVIHYAKKHDIESQYAKQQDEAGNFTINEMHNYAKSKGTSLEKMTIEHLSDKAGLSEDEQKAIDIMITPDKNNRTREVALKEAGLLDVAGNIFSKIDDSSLPKGEKDRLKELIQGKMAFDDVSANENSTTLTELLSDDDLKKNFESGTQSNQVKSRKIFTSFNKKYGNLSPDEYADKVADLLGGLKAQKNENGENSNIAFVFYGEIMKNATKEQKDALMKKLGASFYNIANVNNLDAEQTQSLSKKSDGDLLRASAILNNADDVHFEHTGALAQSKNAEIGKLSVDKNNQVKDADIQRRYLKNYENAISEVRAYGAENSYKLLEANQVFGLETFIKGDKMATDAANNSGVVAKMAAKNQTEAMKSIKSSIENLWKDEDAISRLNNLSDQIKDCDSSNQLDMHKSFMSSQYTEVQEHAAGNIKSYNPSVQLEAYESTYATGNQKAIEIAYNNLQTSPSEIQNAILKPIINTAFDENNAGNIKILLDKIKSGSSLTLEEYNSLTAKQKQEYKAAYFKSLSPAKQIALINSLSDISTKKAVIKKLAQADTSFLKQLIDSDAKTAELVYGMGILQDYIRARAEFKSESNNDFRNLLTFIEKKEAEANTPRYNENPITARTLRNNNKYDIFKRDRSGNVLA